MGQFIKFTFASCLGVLIAMICLFLVVLTIGIGAAGAGKQTVVENGSVLKIDIDYQVPELTNNNQDVSFSFTQDEVLGIQEIIDLIGQAKDDSRIEGIYLYPTHTALGLTQTFQLAEALTDFKDSGKWVISYAEYYSQGSYGLAAVADTIILNPIGSVDFRGFAAFVPYFKELLDKTGIKMQIYYAGDYKSATEPFRRTDMSPENRLQTREYLDDAYDEYLNSIAVARGMTSSQLYQIANELRSRASQDAQNLGLVDIVGYEDQAAQLMRGKIGLAEDKEIPFITLGDYALAPHSGTNTAKDRIAIVYAEGEIIPGETSYGIVGDQRYSEVLTKIRNDKRIKAVVLRVNSPGGSILAADNILRQLTLLKASGKPIVVSMGDYAASGGYYISIIADSIFAEPSTLTGSIGVYSMIPNPQELLNDKLGIYFDTVRTGAYSSSFSPFFDWSEPEHTYLQQRTDGYYDLFLEQVSQYRNMTKDEVHTVAQGRIWSGKDALSKGLVDRIGDLDDAIRAAASLADLSEYKTTAYPKVPNQFNKLIAEITGEEVSIADNYLEARIGRKLPYFKELKALLSYSEPVARLPVVFSVH